ncbi:hypothetical protein JOL62DRAFT_609682 [Phyllosticta paracitricarpa]|uniref:Uncharacterized protein n=1 Tax=Phyllosticta paracitricarpa TaxID=2016321 RepID=A0ABR1NFS6_9PEZI
MAEQVLDFPDKSSRKRKRATAELTSELWYRIGKIDEWREELRKAFMLMSESFEKRGKDLTTEARDLLIERAENLLRLFSRIADERDEIMSTIADNPEIEAEVFQNTWYIQMKDIQHWANLTLKWSMIEYWPASKNYILNILTEIQSLEEMTKDLKKVQDTAEEQGRQIKECRKDYNAFFKEFQEMSADDPKFYQGIKVFVKSLEFHRELNRALKQNLDNHTDLLELLERGKGKYIKYMTTLMNWAEDTYGPDHTKWAVDQQEILKVLNELKSMD